MPRPDATMITARHVFVVELALAAAGAAPEWIQIFPAGGDLAASDGRRWKLADATAVVAASLGRGVSLAIDWEHAQDHRAPKGEPAPAAAWIEDMQVRGDTIFARLRWSESGKRSVEAGEYRYFSPTFVADRAGKVLRVLGGALVNRPAFTQLPALAGTQENDMEFLKALCAALGIKEDSDEKTALAAVKKLKENPPADATAIAAEVTKAIAPIAKAAGLKEDATGEQVVTAVTTLAAAGGDKTALAAVQGELNDVTKKFNALSTQVATDRATAFVDGAIKLGRVGVKPMRDHYIARHAAGAESAAAVEKEINSFAILGPGGVPLTPPPADGKVALSAEQLTVARLTGVDPEAMKKTLAAEAAAAG
ncbi:MAG: phage protease [Xanthobacteraceae bacterium]